MNRRTLIVGTLGALATISCAAGGSQGSSYVLLDPEARSAGLTLMVDDHAVTSALPIEVPLQARLTVLGPSMERALTASAGELTYVVGPKASVSHLEIGRQVAIDRLHITGDEGAAKELASQLGGKLTSDPAGMRLEVPEVFAATAYARAPEHLLGVAPVMNDDPAVATPRALASRHVDAPSVRGPGASNPLALPPVLLLEPEPGPMQVIEPFLHVRTLSPVSFAPAAACGGVGGTWRGRVYSSRHLAYYDFTLDVRQHGQALQGSIVAHFWDASTDDVEPPSGCSGQQHVKVVESATGSVDDAGTMRFESRGWQVSHHLCGEKVTEYWPDRFAVLQAVGASSADATLSDDRVWTDGLPIALTRVSCAR